LNSRKQKAIENLGNEKLKRLLPSSSRILTKSSDEIDYFDCSEILKALLAEDDAGKNFMGQYKNSQVYEWDKIKSAYEASNLHIAEASRDLISMCLYEVPSQRANLNDAKKKLVHAEKNVATMTRMIQQAKQDLRDFCVSVNIDTDDLGAGSAEHRIEDRILRSINTTELQEALQEVRNILRSNHVKDACALYDDFQEYIMNTTGVSQSNDEKFAPSLALMRRLQSEDEPDLEAGNYLDARTSNDADETDATTTAIDWGDDDGNMGLEIDWGAGDVVADDADAGNNDTLEIDWGIEACENGMDDDAQTTANEISDGSVTKSEEKGVSNTTSLSPSLADAEYREKALDDIVELIAFLEQRVKEVESNDRKGLDLVVKSSDDVARSMRFQNAATFRKMLEDVRRAESHLASTKLHEKLLIASSAQYRNRIAKKIMGIRIRSVKLADAQIKNHERRRILISSIADLESQCAGLGKTAKNARTRLADLISIALDGRGVRVIGTRL